eukprot:1009788-Prymnesium_polylepis.1
MNVKSRSPSMKPKQQPTSHPPSDARASAGAQCPSHAKVGGAGQPTRARKSAPSRDPPAKRSPACRRPACPARGSWRCRMAA